MPPKTSQSSVSTEQYQLLCEVIQHCSPPKKEAWDDIAQKLGITNGNAAQQRFGRLLKALKAGEATGSPAGGVSKAKQAGKRSTSRKASGKKGKQAKDMEEDEGDEGDEDDDLDEEETPTKKRKTGKEFWTPEYRSLFGRAALKDKYEAEDEVAGPAVAKKDGYY